MKKYRTVIATVIALFFYTITDILIWQRIFEANNMVGYADLYHTGWFVTLAGYAVMGTILLWGSWKDCLYFVTSLFVAAFSGLEDVLLRPRSKTKSIALPIDSSWNPGSP